MKYKYHIGDIVRLIRCHGGTGCNCGKSSCMQPKNKNCKIVSFASTEEPAYTVEWLTGGRQTVDETLLVPDLKAFKFLEHKRRLCEV